MRKLLFFFSAALATTFAISCGNKTGQNDAEGGDTTATEVTDTTVYGTCGEATSMHSLQLITSNGDTLELAFNLDEDDVVKGGLLEGDKLAVTMDAFDDENIATGIINLTTLEGKWSSLDRNFEIVDGGEIISTVQSEKNPYTAWRILNGQLVLSRDTFNILTLGADTLELENDRGIFVYKRLK